MYQHNTLIVPAGSTTAPEAAPQQLIYHPVPHNYQTLSRARPIRVRLQFNRAEPEVVVGLDIHGDVILGRGRKEPDGSGVDLDLSEQEALRHGVSRIHAMLRPSGTRLFLIDLGSTNGTFVNMVPVGRGMAQQLHSGDVIGLGRLRFTILFGGDEGEQALPADGADAGQSAADLLALGGSLSSQPNPDITRRLDPLPPDEPASEQSGSARD